jgi:tetratricopeptide (TPR) repeat protein
MDATGRLSYISGYIALGMYGEAAAELARLDPSEANTVDGLRLRVELLTVVEDWRGVRRCALRLVQLAPEDPQGWISLAYATRRIVGIRSARRLLRQGSRLHPEAPIISFNLACYAAQLGHFEEASSLLLRAIALEPLCQRMALADPDLEPLRQFLGRLVN